VSDASEQFLDRLTKPFQANHELTAHARREIESRLKEDADPLLEDASQRLEAIDHRNWKPAWTGWLIWVVVLAVLGELVFSALELTRIRHSGFDLLILGGSSWPERNPVSYWKETSAHLSLNDQLLLHGDLSKASDLDRIKALRDSDPSNPAYFADYSIAYAASRNSLPPDFLEIATKLDPDNGWFPAFAAGIIAKNSVKKGAQTKLEKDQRQPPHWDLIDQSSMEQALALIYQAASLPRFYSYQPTLRSRRLALLPANKDVFSTMMNVSYTAGIPSSLGFLAVGDVVAAKAAQLEEQKKPEDLRKLLNAWHLLVQGQIRLSEGWLVEPLVVRAALFQANSNLLQASRNLGLAEETRQLEEVESRIKSEVANRKARSSGEASQLLNQQGGPLEAFVLPGLSVQTRAPFSIDPSDLAPSRRAIHAVIGQNMTVIVGALLIVVIVALAAFRFRHGRLCRELSSRLPFLMSPADWVAITVSGILVPTVYFLIVRYLTPLGGLGWNPGITHGDLAAAQFVLLFLLFVSTSLLMARHRLAKRLGFLASPPLGQRVGLILTLIGYMMLPLLGLARDGSLEKPVQFVGGGVMGMILLWLIGLALRSLSGNTDLALVRQALARVMIPVLVCALILVSATLPAQRAEERYWSQKNTLYRMDPSHASMSRYEWEVTEQMKAELLEMMSPLESLER
jgi:hypothetical protein